MKAPINIKVPENVKLTEEDVREAERLEDSPELMLRLIDMIFGPCDDKTLPS